MKQEKMKETVEPCETVALETLLNYVSARCSPEEEERVELHCVECEGCLNTVVFLRGLQQVLLLKRGELENGGFLPRSGT